MRRARLLEKLSQGLKETGLEPDLIEPILDEAEDGSASAQFIVAAALERASVFSEAMHWYRASARQGFQPAKERLRRPNSSVA
jgi:TPR repeat protein